METKVTNSIPMRGSNTAKEANKTYSLSKKADGLPAPRVIQGITTSNLRTAASFSKSAMLDTTTQPTFFYSPELSQDAWILPKSRVETLRFCQIYYNLDPYIHSIINTHAQYAFSKFYLQYKDPTITELFNKLLTHNQSFDWYDFTLQVALSYYKYGEACLTGDTKIRLLNGTVKTLKELYSNSERDFWVYSVDSNGNIVPGKADCVVLTKKNAKVLEIKLDNGMSFKCTPDHKCMLRDGTYVPAEKLRAGDALMPLYTKEANVYYKTDKSKQKYEMVYNPGIAYSESDSVGKWCYTHRIVSAHINGQQHAGQVVHHKNFNKNDNTPDNLELLSVSEHQKLHTHSYTEKQIEHFRQKTLDLYKQPGYAKKMGESIKQGLQNPEARKKISEASRRMWSDPVKHAYLSELHKGKKHTEETRQKLSCYAKERYNTDPAEVLNRLNKATQKAAIVNKGKKFTKERLVKHSQRLKQAYSSPERRELQRTRSLNYWNKKRLESTEYKNHKVVSVVECGCEDVYDIRTVNKYHNFALDCGVFVHNCVWGDWDAARRTWNRFTLLNPAIVEYKEDLLSGHATIELIPTNEMKQIVKEAIMQGRHDIDPLLLDAVENNRKLPLDTEGVEENVFTGQEYIPPKVFMFQRKTDPSSERGTSPIQCLFKDMYLKDLLRMSQIAVAQKTQLPIELWTVGHLGNDEASSILPGPELLEEVRQMITQATQQPPFSIVYGPYLKYEALGVSGKLLDIYNDMGYIENQIMVGLGVNKAVVLGEGPSVQGKAISLNRLIRSYSVVRDLYSNWFKRNILLPISKANGLLDENGQYIVPDLVWELDLQPELSKETFDMFYKMWKDGLISTMTLFEKCPKRLDYFLEMQRLVEERDSVFNKGDKRLGKAVEKGGKSGGGLGSALDAASEGGVEAGKGNPELRDFALGEGGSDLGDLDTELPENPLRDAINEGAEAPTPEE